MKSAEGILTYIRTQGYEEQIFGQLAKLERLTFDSTPMYQRSVHSFVTLKRVDRCQTKGSKTTKDGITTRSIIRQKGGKRIKGNDKDKMVEICRKLQLYKESGWEKFARLAVNIILSVFGLVSNKAAIKFATDLAKIIFEYLTK